MHTLSLVSDRPRLEELWRLDQDAYGDSNLSLQGFEDWWSRYDLGLSVVERHNQIVGAIGIWGLGEAEIRRFISGQIKESDLQPLTTADLTQSPTQFWYFSGIVAAPSTQGTLGTPLRRLLSNGVRQWATRSHLRFPLHCYALGLTPEGKTLLDKLGFEVIKQPDELPDQLPLYWRSFNSRSALREALR